MDFSKLDAELNKLLETGYKQVPGFGALLYKDGKLVHSCFGGRARLSDGLPFSSKSLFRIASLSKQFTVFAVMQLVEQGRLELDADVSQYLGFKLRHPAFPDIMITPRMLASHTSGIRDGIIYCIPPGFSVREFFNTAGRFYENGDHFAPAMEKPGKFFCYCNLNYGLLGTIIERITNQRFDEYMQEHIMEPLEIDGEFLPSMLSSEEFARLGTIYQKKNPDGIWDEHGPWYGTMDGYHGIQTPYNTVTMQNPYALHDDEHIYSLDGYVPGNNATFFAPQGGLRTSIEGISHALELLMNKGVFRGRRILQESSIDEMLKPQWIYNSVTHNGDTSDDTLLSYGLAEYQIDGRSRARACRNYEMDLVGHTGQAFGLLGGMFFRPGTKDGFVYIMNGEAIPEDTDPRSAGEFSRNYIWEEYIMNELCNILATY